MHYLGPNRPLTSLSTWDEIVTAAEGGLLEENQWCELKAMLPPSSKATNLELARDLASLSVFGGVLIIGVADKTFDVAGVSTEDLEPIKSRVSQVASITITPPLAPVIHDPISSPEGKVVVVVSVPPSPVAPHMADGFYWGRSSDGKRKLSDPEVRTLMSARASNDADFLARLTRMVDRDPLADFTEEYPTGQGHMYFLAEPCAPMPPRPADLDVGQLRYAGSQWGGDWSGTLADCTSQAFDPEGQAFMSGRSVLPARYERNLCHFSVKDKDGSIEVVQGGATFIYESPDGETSHAILDRLVVIMTRQTFAPIREFSTEIGYMGQWRVGINLTNLKGKRRSTAQALANFPPFVSDTYTQTTLTSAHELQDQLDEATDRVLRGFKRGLGIEQWTLDNIVSRG
ncbi:helix-turn-helix domain-containing protein [Ornithinimicrobium sp. LYQ103]|uniref:AlbA family DNA-binding domain-containing protein n=1 Tax=Ornithinimicrobium sp. LYQ103 TaxID=3378796 RepID=UPI00385285FD